MDSSEAMKESVQNESMECLERPDESSAVRIFVTASQIVKGEPMDSTHVSCAPNCSQVSRPVNPEASIVRSQE